MGSVDWITSTRITLGIEEKDCDTCRHLSADGGCGEPEYVAGGRTFGTCQAHNGLQKWAPRYDD